MACGILSHSSMNVQSTLLLRLIVELDLKQGPFGSFRTYYMIFIGDGVFVIVMELYIFKYPFFEHSMTSMLAEVFFLHDNLGTGCHMQPVKIIILL